MLEGLFSVGGSVLGGYGTLECGAVLEEVSLLAGMESLLSLLPLCS